MALETRTTPVVAEPALEPELRQELLLRHRPVLLWDSQEDFRAIAAKTIAVNPGNVLEVDGRVVAGALGEGGNDLSLQLLADGIDGVDFARGARLKEAPFPFAAARRLQQVRKYANRVYGRAVPRGDRIYLQYWSWLYYNPKNLLGYGRHEGDWELAQVALDAASQKPVAVTYAQHGHGERKTDMRQVEWISCEPACTPKCSHPCVYVAPFSHAAYFERGTHVYFPGTDNPDGAVREELPAIVDFGPWKSWPGRWGQQSNPIGPSPASPACQEGQWDPERFEREARSRRPREQRRLWKLGLLTFPEPPEVDTAALDGDTVVVCWRVTRRVGWWPLQLGLRPTWLLLTVRDGPRVIRRRTVKVTRMRGESRIPLATEPPARLAVQASAFNVLRQRSDPSRDVEVMTRTVVRDGAPRARDDWGPRVWKTFHRELVKELTRRGAATIAELQQRRMHVLDLALDRLELEAVVDSARRAGLVAPLGQERRADGTEPDGPEWAATDAGRRRLTSFLPWLFRVIAVLPFALLVPVGKEVGPWLEDQDTAAVLLVAAAIVFCAVALGAFFYHRLGGASPREVASQWSRHAVELPALNRTLTWRLAKAVPVAVVSALCIAVFVGALVIDDELSTALLVAAIVIYLIGAVGVAYLYVGLLLGLVRQLKLVELRMEAAASREAGRTTTVRRVPSA